MYDYQPEYVYTKLWLQIYLLSYYLAKKRSIHVHSQGIEIPTLIGENRKTKITHHYHYNKN